MSFVDEHWLNFTFECTEENSFIHSNLHQQFCLIVDQVLNEILNEAHVSPDEFISACKCGLISKEVVNQLLALDDYLIFRRMMIERNHELDLEAQEFLNLNKDKSIDTGSDQIIQRFGALNLHIFKEKVKDEIKSETISYSKQILNPIIKATNLETACKQTLKKDEEERHSIDAVDEKKTKISQKLNHDKAFMESSRNECTLSLQRAAARKRHLAETKQATPNYDVSAITIRPNMYCKRRDFIVENRIKDRRRLLSELDQGSSKKTTRKDGNESVSRNIAASLRLAFQTK